jgi:hypothetical protein
MRKKMQEPLFLDRQYQIKILEDQLEFHKIIIWNTASMILSNQINFRS